MPLIVPVARLVKLLLVAIALPSIVPRFSSLSVVLSPFALAFPVIEPKLVKVVPAVAEPPIEAPKLFCKSAAVASALPVMLPELVKVPKLAKALPVMVPLFNKFPVLAVAVFPAAPS